MTTTTITRRAQHLGRGFLEGPTMVTFASLIWRPAGPLQWVCEMLSRAYLHGGGAVAVAGIRRRWRGH